MELSKKTFSGENLRFLQGLSPTLKTLIGTAESKEIKADTLFVSEKRGKTAAQKFYLFVALLFFDRQQIYVKGKYSTFEVRRNIGSKREIEDILKEAGIQNTEAIFTRAEKHYKESEQGKTAPKATAAKGKIEHSAEALREAEYERAMKKITETMRKEQEERNAYQAAFVKESAKGWATRFPGKPYPPTDPGWQWDHSAKTWIYFPPPPVNPFYNNESFRGKKEQSRNTPSAPAPKISGCQELLAEKKITTYRTWLEWARDNHPDKGGDTVTFQDVSNCVDKVLKKKGGSTRRRQKRRQQTRRR
jgi:hypothetical protein